MKQTSALRPLVAVAAGSQFLSAAMFGAAAPDGSEQDVTEAVAAASVCGPRTPDNPKTGSNLGPLFHRAV